MCHLDMIQLGIIDGRPVSFCEIEQALQGISRFFSSTHKKSGLVCCHASVSRCDRSVLADVDRCELRRSDFPALEEASPADFAPAIMKFVRQYFGSHVATGDIQRDDS
jgi:hypothetical protein